MRRRRRRRRPRWRWSCLVTRKQRCERTLRGRAAERAEACRLASIDVGYSLATTRSALRHRAAWVVDWRVGVEEIANRLQSFGEGSTRAEVMAPSGHRPGEARGAVHGAGQPASGYGPRALRGFSRVPRGIRRGCDASRWRARPAALRGVVRAGSVGSEALLDQTAYTQPALFAL